MTNSEALSKYTNGELSLEETNAILDANGSTVSLNPSKNLFSAGELLSTVVGDKPEDAIGWGILDTGTGTLDKVYVDCGKLATYANEADAYALLWIGGKTYRVMGDSLVDMDEEDDGTEPPDVPEDVDYHRRKEFANTKQIQHTKKGSFEVEYGADGKVDHVRRWKPADQI